MKKSNWYILTTLKRERRKYIRNALKITLYFFNILVDDTTVSKDYGVCPPEQEKEK